MSGVDQVGSALTAAGGVNNDGVDDILIGVRDGDAAARDAGEAFIIFGSRPVDDEGGDPFIGNGGPNLIVGDADGNRVVGNGGADSVNGGGDVLVGGAGADAFVFTARFGRDVIADFEAGVDALRFAGGDDIGDANFRDVNGDVEVRGLGGVLTIEDTSVAELSASDFIFF
ncbi:MAG: hypothetical protein AAFU55_12740 [Pseudomonadota bacterium]